jgi:hypothetical protein
MRSEIKLTSPTKIFFLICMMLMLTLSACRSSPPQNGEPTPEPEEVLTSAAQTAAANLTEFARPLPTDTPAPTDTLEPTVTATATLADIAVTPTFPAAAVTPTGAPTGGDVAEFVADITVPDGTNYNPGEAFTKTWRLRNAGTNAWTTAYSLAFIGGAQMGGPNSVSLAGNVAPGSTVDISVNLVAPQESGEHRGFWKLRNAAGEFFDGAVYVEINVLDGTPAPSPTPDPDSDAQVTAITFSVDNAAADTCPYNFTFTATITLNEASSVTYQLEAEASTPGFQFTLPSPSTVNFSAGTHTIIYNLNIPDPVQAWARLRVTYPNEIVSDQVNFTLTCP